MAADLFPFFACLAGFVFGAAAFLLILAALRISDLVADEAQFLPSPDLTDETRHVASSVRG